MADKQQTAKSVQDIAAMLMTKSPTEGTSTVEETDETVSQVDDTSAEDENDSPTEGTSTETDADDGQDEGEDVFDEGEAVEDEEEADEEEVEDDEVEVQEIELDDDVLVEVMIDGQLETRTLAQLKQAAAGEGAIEKRLQEATELRKTAHAERTTMLEKLFAQEAIVTNVLSTLDDSFFKPLIPKPNEAMKVKNPSLYLQQMEAYEYDQKRIKDAKEAVSGRINELGKQRAERLEEYAKQAAAIIAKEIPDLVSKDPAVSQKTFERMVTTAKQYGYTEQEINSALDPRMFKLVHDAMRLQDMLSKSKEVVKDVKAMAAGKKPIRKLKAGASKAKTAAMRQSKEQSQLKQKAKATGSVQDVAAMLVKRKG